MKKGPDDEENSNNNSKSVSEDKKSKPLLYRTDNFASSESEQLNLAIQLSANIEAQNAEKTNAIQKEKALLQYDSKTVEIDPDKLMSIKD